jgi:hypothetical protein
MSGSHAAPGRQRRVVSALRQTAATPDGGAVIACDDRPVLVAALTDGIRLRGQVIGRCPDCHPGRVCEAHALDLAMLQSYRTLAAVLLADQ